MNKIIKFLKDPVFRYDILSAHNLLFWKSDEQILKDKYFFRFHKPLNLDNPQTYNEKLQWLKLNDHRPEYVEMVDKYLAKSYVRNKIGDEYIIPTLGVWNKFEDIDFDKLPNEFVLKCTHDSGGLVICKDKRNFDYNAAKTKIKKCLKRNYFYVGREWPYKNVKPRIIAETYMEDQQFKELRDYKFFCFNGFVKMLFIATNRQSAKEETNFDFFDSNFNHLPITNGHTCNSNDINKPVNFELMKSLAEKLSAEIPHLRVDFYEVNGKVYFGELTFFHWSGLVPFNPPEWDYTLGSWIELP